MNNPDHLAADLAAFRAKLHVVELKARRTRGGDLGEVLPDLIGIRDDAAALLSKWGDRLDESVPFKKRPPIDDGGWQRVKGIVGRGGWTS